MWKEIVLAIGCLVIGWTSTEGQCSSPVQANGQVDVVFLDMTINRLDEVDFDQQTFKVDFFMEMWWSATLSGINSGSDSLQQEGNLNEELLNWMPENEFINSKEIELVSRTPCHLQDGWILSIFHYRGIFFSDMDLKRFPFDRHVLSIELEDVNANLEVMQYRYGSPVGWKPEGDSLGLNADQIFQTTLDFPEYTIEDKALFISASHEYETSMGAKTYSQAKLDVAIERKPGFYFSKVLLITGILAICSLFIFLIPSRDFSTRLEYGVAVLLAMIGHNFATKDLIPKVSYLTTLDIITITSNAMIFFLLIMIVLKKVLVPTRSR